MESERRYFKVVYTRDAPAKKRKRFFDGFVALGERATLFDENGAQRANAKTRLTADAEREIEFFFVGAFYVEIDSAISAADFLSGKCFLSPPIVRFQTIRRAPTAAPSDDGGVWLNELSAARGVVRRCRLEAFLARQLHPHQLDGVRFLFEHIAGIAAGRAGGGGCVLADAMGLGKTLQVVAVVWTLLRQSPYAADAPLVRKTCVVAPLTLVHNWEREFRKWLGELRLQPFVLLAQSDGASLPQRAAKFAANGQRVAILSYEALLAAHSQLRDAVDLLVCDEGHRIKNANGKLFAALDAFPTRRRVLITGTPLQNSLEELHSCLRFAAGELFRSKSAFREVFAEPIAAGLQSGASAAATRLAEERAAMLVATFRPFLLRRPQSALARVLPPRREFIVVLALTAEQRAAESALFAEANRRLFNAKTNKLADLFALLGSVRRLYAHPWLHAADRGTVAETLAAQRRGEEVALPNSALSPKTRFLRAFVDDFLARGGAEKLIVVSYSTRALDLAELLLAPRARCLRLDGRTPLERREAVVRAFCDARDPTRLLLLCAKAGGTGLNLVAATRMLILDVDWNPGNEAQVMARIFRPGQTRPVFVHRLVVGESVEQEMLARQLDKETLAELLVDARGAIELFRQFGEREALGAFLGAQIAPRASRKSLANFPTQLRRINDLESIDEFKNLNFGEKFEFEVFEKLAFENERNL